MSSGRDYRHRLLELHLVKGRLRLQVDEAIYSYDDLYHVFQEAFKKIPLSNIKNNALVLGYGLGSIPFILEKGHGRKLNYTGVELDNNIIHLAQKYASPRLESNINIIQADAQEYLACHSEKYDLVCVDIFVGGEVPAFAKNELFLKQLADSLTPRGLLLFNYLKENEKDFEDFYKKFKNVFANGSCLDLDSNYILRN